MMLKVYLADDEYYVRTSLKENIPWQEHNFEVVGEANNGKTALEQISALKPDIAVIDINMPGYNGIELIHRLTEMNISCKFIILTGYSEFQYAQQAVRLGVCDYILKPIDYPQLIQSLNDIKASLLSEPSACQKMEELETEHSTNGVLNRSADYSDVTKKIEQYIQTHYGNSELTIPIIAENLYLNYSYLCFCFKRDKNITINDYLNQVRIGKSVALLQSGIDNISYIAERTGYNNAGYFSKRFKKATGLSPSEYLKTL